MSHDWSQDDGIGIDVTSGIGMQRTNLNMLQFPIQLNAAVTQTNMYATKIEQCLSVPFHPSDEIIASTAMNLTLAPLKTVGNCVPETGVLDSPNVAIDLGGSTGMCSMPSVGFAHCTVALKSSDPMLTLSTVRRPVSGRVREKALLMKLAVGGTSRPGTNAASLLRDGGSRLL